MSPQTRDCTIIFVTLCVLGLLLGTPFLISPVDGLWQIFHITFSLWAFTAWIQTALLIVAYEWIKSHPESKPEETKQTLRASLLIFIGASILVLSTLLVLIVDNDRILPFGGVLVALTVALIGAHARFSSVQYTS